MFDTGYLILNLSGLTVATAVNKRLLPRSVMAQHFLYQNHMSEVLQLSLLNLSRSAIEISGTRNIHGDFVKRNSVTKTFKCYKMSGIQLLLVLASVMIYVTNVPS